MANIRNWWITADVDGRESQVSGGPRGKDGGIYLVIAQRSNGEISNVLTVVGTAREDGRLFLEVLDHDGHVIHEITTLR